MTKIQQKIDVLQVKIQDLADAYQPENKQFKDKMIRLRQLQLMHEHAARRELEKKISSQAFAKNLNARQPIALACFSKNPMMVDLLLKESAETEIGIPPEETEAQPKKLIAWCEEHFKLGSAQMNNAVPSELAGYVREPIFGVFCTWVHHVHHRKPDSTEFDPLEGLKVEMTLDELIHGFQRFGLWPTEMSMKKLAVLGMCSGPHDAISDNGLHKIFLNSVCKLLKSHESKSKHDPEQAPGQEDFGDNEISWHRLERAFQRKLEKLFFAALQLNNGVGGKRGAYETKDQDRLRDLVYEAEKEYRLLATLHVLQRMQTEETIDDIRRLLRNNKLRLKCLDMTDEQQKELEEDLSAISEEDSHLLQIQQKPPKRLTQRSPADVVVYSVNKHETLVEQLTIDFEQFKWMMEVVSKVNLADMSLAEFARLVFLEKVVDLKVDCIL